MLKSGDAGGGGSHNNMPPYIALKTCQKVAELDVSSFATKT